MRSTFAAVALTAIAVTTLVPTQAARADENDLREFRVGMEVGELPRSGYLGFACADSPEHRLNSWQEYRQCPLQASSLRAIRFRYDENANPLSKVNDTYEGTKVGGHPVRLTLLIGDADRVRGLVIETDPTARLFMHKKAFLFGEQVKARYGEESWVCVNQDLTSDEEPIGGVSVKEHCDKMTATRHFVLDRALFRRSGRDLKDFVSWSRLEIRDTE
ncbi:MAG: hypothetical protein ACRYHQ_18200 [Janthinobacterium lividum]